MTFFVGENTGLNSSFMLKRTHRMFYIAQLQVTCIHTLTIANLITYELHCAIYFYLQIQNSSKLLFTLTQTSNTQLYIIEFK